MDANMSSSIGFHNSLLIALIFTASSTAVRLQILFQLLDGSLPNTIIQGFFHIGNDYSVFLRTPTTNDKYLTYELYETLNVPNSSPKHKYPPSILAISQIPVEYIKEQLRMFREELYNATNFDNKIVPGTQLKTLREWQIEKALRSREENQTRPLRRQPLVLRTLVI